MKDIILSIIVAVVLLFALAFFVAVPEILRWLSGYIGELFTWIIYLGLLGSFIAWCFKRA